MMRAIALVAALTAGTASAQEAVILTPAGPTTVAPVAAAPAAAASVAAAPVATTGLVFGGLSTAAAVGIGVAAVAGLAVVASVANSEEGATNGTNTN